jgi:hypothetical protein
MKPNTDHIHIPHSLNGVPEVYSPPNELEIFAAVSDTKFTSMSLVLAVTRFFGAEMLMAATHSPFEFNIGAPTQ